LDNLKARVIKTDLYDPYVERAYGNWKGITDLWQTQPKRENPSIKGKWKKECQSPENIFWLTSTAYLHRGLLYRYLLENQLHGFVHTPTS
jgi:hypothetical protein